MSSVSPGGPVRGVGIVGTGEYRPRFTVGNAEIADRIGRPAEWIERRTGIRERAFAGPDESVADMAVEATTKAIADAGLRPQEIDAVVLTTMSEIRQTPCVAPEVAHRIGASCGAFDLDAACAGYCYALGVATTMVACGAADHVVVVGSDKMSDIVDPTDPYTAPLFGDGAGATVIGPREQPGIGPVVWGSDGGGRDLIAHRSTWLDYRDTPETAWPTMHMAGPEVFRWVLQHIPGVARDAAAAAGTTPGELDLFVPHQANRRIVDGLADRLDLPDSTTICRDVVTSGNTSAASIPAALDRMRQSGEAHRGDRALLVGFGGGLTWAGQVVVLP